MRGISASYQQIHDAVDVGALNARLPLVMTGMEFRPANSYVIAARQFDVQITLSVTSVSAATMTTTFTANFGPASSVVLPYTTMNLPAGAGVGANPNPPLWKFPFKSVFVYAPATGNLCWDWRHRNSNNYINTFIDYVAGQPSGVPVTNSLGTGCTATGQSAPARANFGISGANLVASLANGTASASVILGIGLVRSPVALFCGTLHFAPLIVVGGTTDVTGAWGAGSFPTTVLNVQPYTEVFMQYGFADAGLPGGVGLSNLAVGAAPANRGKHVSRVWALGQSAGFETATVGFLGLNNGLVSMFTIL
jgi:hypothetical protein